MVEGPKPLPRTYKDPDTGATHFNFDQAAPERLRTYGWRPVRVHPDRMAEGRRLQYIVGDDEIEERAVKRAGRRADAGQESGAAAKPGLLSRAWARIRHPRA
jgi:hypothetical protein